MKKILLALFIFGAVFWFSSMPALAYGWEINQFDADINIYEDSSILVTEKIQVYFDYEKHGIYRDIPVKYENKYGDNFKLRLDVISVEDENGNPYEYELMKTDFNKYQRIKIGSPSYTIIGQHTYIITYRVERALNYFDTWDELYWNVTGTEWEVPILNATATVHLPADITHDYKTKCFTGYYGSVYENCYSNIIDNRTVEFSSNDYLTIVLGWPKNIVAPPSLSQGILWYLTDNYIILLPVLVFIFFLWWWNKRGRDPKGKGVIIAQFDPPEKMSPAEVGYLHKQRFDTDFLSAIVVDLAVRGYLKIKEEEKKGWIFDNKEYTFSKLKDDSGLSGFEKEVFNNIFTGTKNEVKLSALKQKFYKNIPDIKQRIMNRVKDKGYFIQHPNSVKWTYISIAILVFCLSWGGWILGAMFFLAIMLSSLIIFGFAFIMPKRTKQGVLAYEHSEGFELFIKTAEQYRLKWQEKENMFEKYLPYAMVYGLVEKWTNAFEDIMKQQPDWYESSQPFSVTHFGYAMNDLSSGLIKTMTSTPAPQGSSGASGGFSGFSSGGGFSGGGFGGGGGGSW